MRKIKFSIKIPTLCPRRKKRRTEPAYPGVPESLQESESTLTPSEKDLSQGNAIVGTGDLRKLLLKQQKDHSKVLKAYLKEKKKVETFSAKETFLQFLFKEMDIETIKKENFIPEFLNFNFKEITKNMPPARARQIMTSLKQLRMIEVVELADRQNLERKIKELDATLPATKPKTPIKTTSKKRK